MTSLDSMTPSGLQVEEKLVRTHPGLKDETLPRLSHEEKEEREVGRLPKFPLLKMLGLGGAETRRINYLNNTGRYSVYTGVASIVLATWSPPLGGDSVNFLEKKIFF